MASIILMMIVGLAIVVVVSVASMVVMIFMIAMLMVAQFTATGGRKMSRFLFLWLLFVLGDLLKNASRLVGCLTLLKESDYFERVSRHRLLQVDELVLVCLRLHEEDLLTLLLHCGYFHHLTEVATLKVAKKLYSTLHELVHWHESGLLGRTKPQTKHK